VAVSAVAAVIFFAQENSDRDKTAAKSSIIPLLIFDIKLSFIRSSVLIDRDRLRQSFFDIPFQDIRPAPPRQRLSG
jgi:hypothetical protein